MKYQEQNRFLSYSHLACQWILDQCQKTYQDKIEYVCTPCGLSCDKDIKDKPGKCSGCSMKLVDKKTITP
jgi:DNA-directed RNA polymerase subunit RPC12/RpoP